MSDNQEYQGTSPGRFERITNNIEAFRVTSDSAKKVAAWCGAEVLVQPEARGGYIRVEDTAEATGTPVLRVPNINGPVIACYTDWVIKTEDGRFSVMSNKDFQHEFRFIKAPKPITFPEGVR